MFISMAKQGKGIYTKLNEVGNITSISQILHMLLRGVMQINAKLHDATVVWMAY
jgi:hypothetical protein